jgi:hypothetical protein
MIGSIGSPAWSWIFSLGPMIVVVLRRPGSHR